jgi:nitroreductase
MKKARVGHSTDALTALDVIFTRRSVRSFQSGKLDQATIRGLLDAAVQAPTAMHLEPWAFVVVEDRAALRRYSDSAKRAWVTDVAAHRELHLGATGDTERAFAQQIASPDFDIFYNAPALIVICGKPVGPFVAGDCWLAAENLMLAAAAMGLGSCCVGSALPALTAPDVRRELAIPDGYEVVAPIVVGVPADVTSVAVRKDPEILSWT